MFKILYKYKLNRVVKKENILVDHERYQSVWIENSKKVALKIEDVQQNKWKIGRNGS